MSAVDEDTELRDLLVQTLDKNGVLGKIKAELRANIFLALEEQDKIKNPSPLKNKPLNRLIDSAEGKACVSVINEFLKKYNLDYTSAVFRPESNMQEDMFVEINELRTQLNLPVPNPTNDSILYSMIKLKSSTKSMTQTAGETGLNTNQIEFIRNKFESFSMDGGNTVDKKDISAVLSLACPRFNPSMLEVFVNEELKNKFSTSVNFHDFTHMLNKLYEMCNAFMAVGNWDENTSIPLMETNVKSPETIGHFSASPSYQINDKSNNIAPQSMEIATSFHNPMDDEDFYTDPKSDNSKRSQSNEDLYSEKSEATNENWSENRRKVAKLEYSNEYNDDFNSESNVSITEDIQDDISGLSSEQGSNLDLTDDQTVSEAPKADYMESVNLHYK